jgi:poly(beta-D-mannuronate) lyase
MAACAGFAATPDPSALRSPWDAKVVAGKSASYSCPKLEALPKDIEASSFYSDAKHSVIDEKKYAAYKAASDQFAQVMKDAEKAADTFQKNGNRGAAECVLEILDAQAAAHAMTGTMSSNQAYYVQNWTLGALAVTWLKVREAEPGTAAQREAATEWMQAVAGQTREYFTARHIKKTNDGTNNHYYWAGFAVMAAAVSANDHALYDWGKSTFEYAVTCVQADGTLPLEMGRGQRALHYHVFAITPMIMMAEFGEANGEDLYSSSDRAVQRLATRIVAGLLDKRYFTEKAGTVQDTPNKDGVKSSDVIWLAPYLKRFPDVAMEKVFRSTELKPGDYIGGLPPA